MFAKLLLLFIIVPIIELMLLLKVGELIHFWPTIGIIVVTGVLGAELVKRQGREALSGVTQKMQQGELPKDDLVKGILVFVAGVLLVTPGILTDITGFLLLSPPVQRIVQRELKKRFAGHLQVLGADGKAAPNVQVYQSTPWTQGDVIDVNPEPDGRGPNADSGHRQIGA